MESGSLLPCSKEPASVPYSKPDKSGPHPPWDPL